MMEFRKGTRDKERTRFKTLNECVEYVCVSLGEYASAHNVESIVREAFMFNEHKQAFVLAVGESEYWELVKGACND